MTQGERSPGLGSFGLVGGLLVLVVVAVLGGLFLLSRSPKESLPDTINSANNNAVQQLDLDREWPRFGIYQVRALMPRGMHPCVETNPVFSIRTDACTDKTDPSYRFRRLTGLDGRELVDAFNTTFAQELREAGLETIQGHGTTLQGKGVSVIYLTLSEDRTIAIARELNPPAGVPPRIVSVEVFRQRQPTVDGVPQDVDETMKAVLGGILFSPNVSNPANDNSGSS